MRSWLALGMGRWAYHRGAWWRGNPPEPLNGQTFRQRMVAELVARLGFVAIVETGTYQGTTTAYLRRTSDVPIHSFEIDPRHYGLAAARLSGLPDLHLHLGDSRSGLRRLATAGAFPAGPVLFYLDAHWLEELPLAEEIAIAFQHWPDAVLMIDDFAVPDDPGYGFDDYGPGRTLTLDYLIAHHVLPAGVWFPRCAASAETGARRGCVVLARAAAVVRRVDALGTLRRWEQPPRASSES